MKKLILALAVVCGTTFHSTTMAQTQPASTTKPIEIDMATFTQKVGKFDEKGEGLEFIGKKPVVIDFYATWCGPCKKMEPSLEQIAMQMSDLTVYKVDVDKNPELAAMFKIRSMPTLIYIPLDGAMAVTTGYMSHQALVDAINKFIFKK